MGRVGLHWKSALERSGWTYRHFGAQEVPMPKIKPLWALAARHAWTRARVSADLFLAHEPVAETFRGTGVPTVLFSHGLEARCRELAPVEDSLPQSAARELLIRPFWRWRSRQTELALRKSPLLLLINEDDRRYVMERYGRRAEDIFVFRNGVDASPLRPDVQATAEATVLFYGSWLARKGKRVLIQAAQDLAACGIHPRWLLAGTGCRADSVLAEWPSELRDRVEVVAHVPPGGDEAIYARATLFVLPSFFEGQPLTLLQAMESGRCVITSRCCGQKDIVKHGHNGLFFEPGEARELARQIAAALSDREMRRKLGTQAKADMAGRRWAPVSDEVAERIRLFAHEQGIPALTVP
jgi:glycosyltransferase involved in cell wall biosynthesis